MHSSQERFTPIQQTLIMSFGTCMSSSCRSSNWLQAQVHLPSHTSTLSCGLHFYCIILYESLTVEEPHNQSLLVEVECHLSKQGRVVIQV